MIRRRAAALVASPLLLVAANAQADRRAFTHTYEYMTMPDNGTEVELYSTQTRSAFSGAAARGFELQLELEHGLTDHCDVALYHVFSQTSGATPSDDVAFHFDRWQVESRYRFKERGDWPVDVEVYGEAAKDFGVGDYEGEGKLIVARDFDKLTAAVNLIGNVEYTSGDKQSTTHAGWAAGLTYEVSPELKVGGESWGELATADTKGTLGAYAGPAVSWAPSTGLWVAGTAGFGLSSHADDLAVTLAMGLHLE